MIATYAIFIDDVFASVESCIASVMIMTRRRRQIIVCFCPPFYFIDRHVSLRRTLDIGFFFFSLFFSPTKRPIDAFHRSWRTCPLITIKGTSLDDRARSRERRKQQNIYLHSTYDRNYWTMDFYIIFKFLLERPK